MEKKFYLEPEMEILNVNVEGFFCASPGEEGFNDDFSGGKTEDPDPSDW
ncbi:MAG: hypothetical protein IJ635_08060 [Bacteroidaceae bacterium]|nr:hypothetical protein [Bacteroidaceae bacterium]MBR1521177.1 hypothetical protein [Bacteroidaceae bacterium]